MALEKKNISFPFLRGRNSTPGEKAQVFGELQSAKNLICENTGDLKSRTGFEIEGNTIPPVAGRQTGGGGVLNGDTLIASGDNIIILDKETSSTYVKGKDDIWLDKGDIKACNYEETAIDNSPTGTSGKPATVSSNGYDLHVWVEQSFDKDIPPSPNLSSEAYRLKPAALYYMIRGTKTGTAVVPKTKIEDAVIELRTPGRWSPSGPAQGTGRAGPLISSDASAEATKHVFPGNICVLKDDEGADTGRPISELGTQEANPAYNYATDLNSDSQIHTGDWAWEKYGSLGRGSLFIDYTKGPNANYYQMKPQLFLAPSGEYAVLIYANGENPGAASYNDAGKWKVFWRFIYLGPSTPFDGEFGARQDMPSAVLSVPEEVDLLRTSPIWDADYCLDPIDSPTLTAGGAETQALGIALAYYADPGGAGKKVIVKTYRVAWTLGVEMVKMRETDVTAAFTLPDLKIGLNSLSPGSGLISLATWGSNPATYGNSVLSPLVLKGMNKLDRGTDKNRIVSDVSNNLVLFADLDPAPPLTQGNIAAIPLSSQAAPKAIIIPGPFDVTYPVFSTTSGLLDFPDCNDIHLVDVAMPTLEDSLAGEIPSFNAVIEVCNPRSGNIGLLAPTRACDSWLIQKEVYKTPTSDPNVIMRNVSIASDGFRSPYVTSASDPEFLFVASCSSVPSRGVIEDDGGRLVLANQRGRILAAWRPYAYSTTQGSEQFSGLSTDKLNNNNSLRGLRSRIAYDESVPYSEMLFGSNNFDRQVNEAQWKWMLPTKATIDFNPPKPFKNTSREGSTYIASGLLWKYDGESFFENEFLSKPTLDFPLIQPGTSHGSYTSTSPDDTNYRILLHCDGTAGQTTFPDSSTYTNDFTGFSGASVDTTTKKFGTGSAGMLAGTNGYLELTGAMNSSFYFDDLSFTIDMWITRPTTATFESLFSIAGPSAAGSSITILVNDTTIRVELFLSTGTLPPVDFLVAGGFPVAKLYHIQVERLVSDGLIYAFVDGTLSNPVFIGDAALNNGTYKPLIGASRDLTTGVIGQFKPGVIDEVRVVIGAAMSGLSNFTPPDEPYPGTKIDRVFTPSGGLAAGFYKYFVNYFWLDANGEAHYSDAAALAAIDSEGGKIAVPENGAVTMNISGLQLTNHRDQEAIAQSPDELPGVSAIQIWRSPVNQEAGAVGLVGQIDMSSNLRSYRFTDDPVIKEGDIPGGSAISGSSLFAESHPRNEIGLFRSAPESPIGITMHRGHLVVSTTDRAIYSSLRLISTRSAAFSREESGPVVNRFYFSPETNDPITHLASTGNTLYCFTQNNAYAYFGEGVSGVSSGYEGPEIAGPSMGVLPSGFAEKIPDGIIYQGQGGFYLLQGKGRPVYFGANVSDLEGFTVADVAVSDENQQIMIAMGGETLNQSYGMILIYNWVYDIWTTWDLKDAILPHGIAGIDNTVDSDGNNRLYVMTSNGRILRQKDEVITDANTWKDNGLGGIKDIDLELSTTWIQLPNSVGSSFHTQFRVYQSNLLGRIYTNPAFAAQSATITARLFADWRNDARSTHTLQLNPIADPAQLETPLEMGIRPKVQKCKAFAMEIKVTNIVAWPPVLQGVAFLVASRGSMSAFETSNVLEGTTT